MSNLTEQDIINFLVEIGQSHRPKLEVKYGPYQNILGDDLNIENSLLLISPVAGGGDLGEGLATYNLQVFVVTKTTRRSGSVEKAFTQSEAYLNRVLNQYKLTYPKHRSIRENRQRINPGELKSNAVGFIVDFSVTVPAPFNSSDW